MVFKRPSNNPKSYSGKKPASTGAKPEDQKKTRAPRKIHSEKFNPKSTDKFSARPRSEKPASEGRKDSFGSKTARPFRAAGSENEDRKPFAKKPSFGRSTAPDSRRRNASGDKDSPYAASNKKPGTRDKARTFDKKEDWKPGAKDGRTKGFSRSNPEPAAPARLMRGRKKPAESKEPELIRLNRYISNAGICSRRKADELIAAGVVSVNGEVVSELGFKVNPLKDVIRYNGETLKREKMVYVLLNKPKDYITTTDDPQERRTVMHLVEKASRERIYPVGRLDRNTTGLLLLTNDGDLADKLSHPRNNIIKLYQAELSKSLTQGDLNKIAFGLELEDGFVKPDAVAYVTGGTKKEVGIQIHSGKNRIVRRIFEHLGYEVVRLDRSVYANLTKKDLPRGRWRYLTENEVIQLKHLV